MKKKMMLSIMALVAFHSINGEVNASESGNKKKSQTYENGLALGEKFISKAGDAGAVVALAPKAMLSHERSKRAVEMQGRYEHRIDPTKNPYHMTPEDFKKK